MDAKTIATDQRAEADSRPITVNELLVAADLILDAPVGVILRRAARRVEDLERQLAARTAANEALTRASKWGADTLRRMREEAEDAGSEEAQPRNGHPGMVAFLAEGDEEGDGEFDPPLGSIESILREIGPKTRIEVVIERRD